MAKRAHFKQKRSQKAFKEAKELFPGGVNSPVRSWKSVGKSEDGPFFAMRAKGTEITDLDGNRYIDLVGSWGPMILGHSDSNVQAALRKQIQKGCSFGVPTELESKLARKIQSVMPSMEKLRFVSSGTEAVMHAVRVARGFTNRAKIIKFDGCYHGASDSLLVKAGSGAATFGVPDSAGIPESIAQHTLVVPFNDLTAARKMAAEHKDDLAAILLEPVVGNSGCIPPAEGFLEGLKALAENTGALLIFDEVMTGFRVSPGGAQEAYGVQPDLTTLGKIVGGGLPCAAYGGRADVMSVIAPDGPVYQAGTLSGNPLAMTAGLATLNKLLHEENYDVLEHLGGEIEDILLRAIKKSKWWNKVCLNRVGSMFTIFFTPGPVTNFEEAAASDKDAHGRFFQSMLEKGVYFPPSQFEAAFLNLSITPKHLKRFQQAAVDTFKEI